MIGIVLPSILMPNRASGIPILCPALALSTKVTFLVAAAANFRPPPLPGTVEIRAHCVLPLQHLPVRLQRSSPHPCHQIHPPRCKTLPFRLCIVPNPARDGVHRLPMGRAGHNLPRRRGHRDHHLVCLGRRDLRPVPVAPGVQDPGRRRRVPARRERPRIPA